MKYKSLDDVGNSTKIVFASDVAEYIRVLSYHNWITKFPKMFLELLNDDYDATLKAIKYAPSLYFHLNSEFQKDKHLIKTTINAYYKHKKIHEIIFDNYKIVKRNSY